MPDTTNYRENAKSDAQDMAREFLDQILEQFLDKDEVSNDFNNDYDSGDSYHHETHVDKEYDLQEAAAVLEQLRDHEETDSGLWDGLEPSEAIAAQAAYTYGNAVVASWQELIEEINDEDSLKEMKTVWDGFENLTSAYNDALGAEGTRIQNEFKNLIENTIKAIIAAFWKA